MSKKEIQQATAKDGLSIKPLNTQRLIEQNIKNQGHQDNYGFGNKGWYSNKFNFEILSYNFIRFVIVVVTTISLMELERAL
ncbi:MAG: hypothetical protein HeimC2_31390 [Candidatus Heimdallarchaeota archaeon LC_2]|nr:MAG: hypothetical protein HeimC2_31390 [Candidatus Heimdallarchaeota archaeon LC_2]